MRNEGNSHVMLEQGSMGCKPGRCGCCSITHRSNSSLGNFLLMTASSLFVNICKEAEECISPGLDRTIQSPHTRAAKLTKIDAIGSKIPYTFGRDKKIKCRTRLCPADYRAPNFLTCRVDVYSN